MDDKKPTAYYRFRYRPATVWFTVFVIVSLLHLPSARGQEQEKPTRVDLYGFVLFNAAYNTGSPQPVDIPVTATAAEEGSFIMTARQTRFGIRFRHDAAIHAGGGIELDLWGLLGSAASGGPTQSAPRARLAYFTLALDDHSSVLFGQYWAVVAPLNPNSLSHVSVPLFSSGGNLWNRIPQIRYTFTSPFLTLEAAALRPFAGEETPAVTQSDYLGSGEYSRLPFLEARGAVSAGGSVLGISGRWGLLDAREAVLEKSETTTYAVAADAQFRVGPLALSGEAFVAQNNRGLFGLAGTTVQGREIKNVRALGGWGQLSYTAGGFVWLAGAGIEDAEDGIRNISVVAGGLYNVNTVPVTFALEVGWIGADRPSQKAAYNTTINFAARYSFP